MHDQGDPDVERGDAERELRELRELFDLAAIPQAETLVERARLFLRIMGDSRRATYGESPLQGTRITKTGKRNVRGHS
jgi:hypothetical protein